MPASLDFLYFVPFGRKQDRKIAGDHPNSFSLYFLILCRLVFLFSLLCAVWQKTRSQNRRRPSKFIFFVFSYFVPASLFIFFTLCQTILSTSHLLEIYFYVFPYCVPASLFIFFTLCRFAFKIIAPPPQIRVTLKNSYISLPNAGVFC